MFVEAGCETTTMNKSEDYMKKMIWMCFPVVNTN